MRMTGSSLYYANSMTPPRAVLTILADDLTGACDTGALFAAKHPVPVTVWPRTPVPAAARAVDTETRTVDGPTAAQRAAAAVAAAPAERIFKKIDSTLRGHVGPEVDALFGATGATGVLLSPAFPARGRTVVERMLMIDGVPIMETAFRRDPELPRSDSGNVIDILRPVLDRPLAWIPLDQVRAGLNALSARLVRLRGTVAIADAETDADLTALVDAALAIEPSPLLVGSAGLARALAARLGLLIEHVPLPSVGRWLIVAGSRHPATRRQVETARAAGLRVLTTSDRDDVDRRTVAAQLAAEARRALDQERFDLVAVTGGDTAIRLFEALGAERFDLVGPPAPGLAFGWLRSPSHPDLAVLTKAGSFGAPDLFVSLRDEALA
ncbi:MAG: hypothetical protein DMD89_14735 [Candidatus Rokuibacteriota bacterium]|nr:MAG: hypothetical protein DMD89_14735 [Candidatus Rokubacteria bacterium]